MLIDISKDEAECILASFEYQGCGDRNLEEKLRKIVYSDDEEPEFNEEDEYRD